MNHRLRTTGFILYSFLIPFLFSCNWHKDRLNIDISKVNIPQVRIHRYDQDLFKIKINDLKSGLLAIQSKYPYFLGTDLNDTVKLAEMRTYLTNPRNIDFNNFSDEKFKDLSVIEVELTNAFRHYQYYFPNATLPHVYTYISGGDYENPVRISDSVMIIALDTYLGIDFKPYFSDGLPLYKVQRMTKEHIIPDCNMALAGVLYPENAAANTLLDQMVDAGKRRYILDALIPETPEYLKFGYIREKFDWITKNEFHVWAAIIENNMLYSSNGQTLRIFFADGPDTPAFGKESPPRIGEWIGWRIVSAYMNSNPEINMQQLIREIDAQKILTRSGYKPE